MRSNWAIYVFITWVGINILSSINDTFYLYRPVSKWLNPVIVPGYFTIALILIYVYSKRDKKNKDIP